MTETETTKVVNQVSYANTFKRHEMKFLLNEEQFNLISEKIKPFMTADSYGLNTILNIYLDNQNNDVIRTSLGKPAYKEKLRLRGYGKVSDNSEAFLEIKKKFKGVVYKRRLELPYKQLHDYITNGIPPTITEQNRQVFEETDYFIRRLELKPAIVLCYDRQAFFGNDDKEFRLTFDGNIRSRRTKLDLRKGDFGERLSNQPFRIMEVKSAGGVPMWLVKILSENKIYSGSFSKYGNIYLNEIRQNRSIKQCSQA